MTKGTDHITMVAPSEDNDAGSKWNPMQDSSASALNLNCPDVLTSADGLAPIKGTFCPLANENGECYKGSQCPHRHHVQTEILNENPKMIMVEEPKLVAHFNCLPFKEAMHTGGFYQGRVVSAESPENFCIALKSGPVCISEVRLRDMKKDKFAALVSEMKEYYSRYDFKNASSYAIRELVAVKMNHQGQEGFFRGAVTDEVIIDSEELPPVPCYLIDLGIPTVSKMYDVAPLNPRFSTEPAMAYRCYLYGISPMFLNYSKTICQKFHQLVDSKDLLIICRQRSPTTDQDLTEHHPYFVDIRVKVDERTYINVKDELVKTNRVLQWNANIYHPAAWEGMTDLEVDILYDNLSTFQGHFKPWQQQEANNVLKKMFKRLKCLDDVMSDDDSSETGSEGGSLQSQLSSLTAQHGSRSPSVSLLTDSSSDNSTDSSSDNSTDSTEFY